MLSALSAAKKRTQPPLRPTDIRLILVIRDLLIYFYFCENGRVSRFNSGDLAGKLKPPIGFRKYALRAENNCLSILFGGRMDFPHEVRFSAGIGPAHFPAEMTRPLGRGHLPFSPLVYLFIWKRQH